MKVVYPRCEKKRNWKLKDRRYRCTKCRHTFSDKRIIIKLSKYTVRKIIQEFVLQHSTNIILGRKVKRGRGTSKQAVFGILCRNGRVLIDGVETKQLVPHIVKKVKKGSVIFSDTWRGYTGIAAKGYIHRLVKHSKDNFVTKGNHINGLEGFWGYLKRKLAAKGGIRRQRLNLYLGEYVWRYNNRDLSLKDQEICHFNLFNNSARYG